MDENTGKSRESMVRELKGQEFFNLNIFVWYDHYRFAVNLRQIFSFRQ